MKFLFVLLFILVCQMDAECQDGLPAFELVKAILSKSEIREKVFYRDSSGRTTASIHANSTFQKILKNFSEEYRKLSLAPMKKRSLLVIDSQEVFLFIDPFFQTNRIELYIDFDEIKFLKNGAKVSFHLTSPMFKRKDKSYWSFICFISNRNGKWNVGETVIQPIDWTDEFSNQDLYLIEKR